MPDHESTIDALASRQFGVVTSAQLRSAGLAAWEIDGRVRNGRLVAVHAGVYRTSGAPISHEQQLLAACLLTEPCGAVSHRAALHLLGCWTGPTPVEVTFAREQAPRPGNVVVHRSRDLHVDHVATVRGLPCTVPVRALVDIGQVVSAPTVGQVLDRMLGKSLVTVDEVRAALVLYGRRGRRGVGPLRRAADDRGLADDLTESVLEAAMLSLLRRADLPLPEVQVPVFVGGRWRRLDMGYPDLKVAFELDGFAFHTDRKTFEDDRVRGNELALLGWQVHHFTHQQVLHTPAYVQSMVRRILELANWEARPA